MNIAATGKGAKDLALGVGIFAAAAAVAYVVIRGKKVLTEDLNPASDKNLAYRAASAITQAVSGDESATLGTKLYDLAHPNQGGGSLCSEAWLKSSGWWNRGYRCQGGKLVKLDPTAIAAQDAEDFDPSLYDWNF